MEKLSERETPALLDALADEYESWTTCEQVIHDFGEVRPFINSCTAQGAISRGRGSCSSVTA